MPEHLEPTVQRSRLERIKRRILFSEDREILARQTELWAEYDAARQDADELGRRRDQIGDELRAAARNPDPDLVADLQSRVEQLDADYEASRLRRQAIVDRLDANRVRVRQVNAKIRRSNVWGAVINLALQVAATITFFLSPYISAKAAAQIHIEYYAAVATIAPVALVAGFAELVVLRPPGPVWHILTFAYPAVGAGTASLIALATHHSTPDLLWSTAAGLAATILSLVLYFIQHTLRPTS